MEGVLMEGVLMEYVGVCVDGECVDGECVDGGCVDGECVDGGCVDGGCVDGECDDGVFEVECCDGDVRLCCNCCVVTVHPFAIAHQVVGVHVSVVLNPSGVLVVLCVCNDVSLSGGHPCMGCS